MGEGGIGGGAKAPFCFQSGLVIVRGAECADDARVVGSRDLRKRIAPSLVVPRASEICHESGAHEGTQRAAVAPIARLGNGDVVISIRGYHRSGGNVRGRPQLARLQKFQCGAFDLTEASTH